MTDMILIEQLLREAESDPLSALLGVLVGALGSYLAYRRRIRQLTRSTQNWDREILKAVGAKPDNHDLNGSKE